MKIIILTVASVLFYRTYAQECTIYLSSGDTLNTNIRAHNASLIYLKESTVEWSTIKAINFKEEIDLDKFPSSAKIFIQEEHNNILQQVNRKIVWNLDQNETTVDIEMNLNRVPDRLEFTISDLYKVTADIKYYNGMVTIGHIRWTPSNQIGNSIANIEEAIFRKSGKQRTTWSSDSEEKLTNAILKALEYYQ